MVQVLIRSGQKVSGNNNNANYYIDFNRILKSNTKYKVSFVYSSTGLNIGNSTTNSISLPAYLHMNLNQESYDINSSSNASSTQLLGLLEWNNMQVATPYTGYLIAKTSTNNPIIINSIPNSNLNIRILDNSNNLWLDTAGTPAQPANYVIILNFEEC